jgi:hypothetical protein
VQLLRRKVLIVRFTFGFILYLPSSKGRVNRQTFMHGLLYKNTHARLWTCWNGSVSAINMSSFPYNHSTSHPVAYACRYKKNFRRQYIANDRCHISCNDWHCSIHSNVFVSSKLTDFGLQTESYCVKHLRKDLAGVSWTIEQSVGVIIASLRALMLIIRQRLQSSRSCKDTVRGIAK